MSRFPKLFDIFEEYVAQIFWYVMDDSFHKQMFNCNSR